MSKKKSFKGYVCTTTANWELDETDIKVYPSVCSLKRNNKCHKGCGITELTIKVGKEITQGRLFNEKANKQKAVPDSDIEASLLSVAQPKRGTKKS